MKKLIISTLALASFNGLAGSITTVGDDGACDFNTIQAAVTASAGNGDTIRIASNKLYVEGVNINDKSLTLQGGYADCGAADLNITDLSQAIVGGVGVFAINISSPNSRKNVTLRSLAFGGADIGISSTGVTDLTAEDVLVSNNGIGVNISGGDQLINFEGISITENDGPGILCSGGDNTLYIEGDSLISENVTSNMGGGILLNNGCGANVNAPTVITANTATSHGGGIAVLAGAVANLNGVEISDNQADFDGNNSGDGGGIYVSGETSRVNAINVKILGNRADKGGAVSVDDSGSFTGYAANSVSNPCSSLGECSQYTGNSVSGFGGVFYATNNGSILAMHALINGNGAPAAGLVAHTNSGGQVEIEGSVIVKNGGEDLPADDLFHIAGLLDNTSSITLDHVTVADNEITDAVVKNSNGVFSLRSSIVQEEADVSSVTNPASHAFECVMVHETDSFSNGGTISIDDPQFINPAAGNYHLKPSSPAIDYCYEAATLTVELGYDIDLENRNYDDPNVVNLFGTFDIGADEYRWDNDLIFMNGFE